MGMYSTFSIGGQLHRRSNGRHILSDQLLLQSVSHAAHLLDLESLAVHQCMHGVRRMAGGRNGAGGSGGPVDPLAVPSFSAWSVGALPPGLQGPPSHPGSAGGTPAGGTNLYGFAAPAGHPSPYAASPRYGDVGALLGVQGYSPQGALSRLPLRP